MRHTNALVQKSVRQKKGNDEIIELEQFHPHQNLSKHTHSRVDMGSHPSVCGIRIPPAHAQQLPSSIAFPLVLSVFRVHPSALTVLALDKREEGDAMHMTEGAGTERHAHTHR